MFFQTRIIETLHRETSFFCVNFAIKKIIILCTKFPQPLALTLLQILYFSPNLISIIEKTSDSILVSLNQTRIIQKKT